MGEIKRSIIPGHAEFGMSMREPSGDADKLLDKCLKLRGKLSAGATGLESFFTQGKDGF